MMSLFFRILFVLAAVPLFAADKPAVTVKAVGDLVMGTAFPDHRLPPDPYQTLFGQVEAELKGADLLFANYEATLTNYPRSRKNTRRHNVYAFRTPPEYGAYLQKAGFQVLSIANNHSGDFGEQGFADTRKNILAYGMDYVGDKDQIVYRQVNGQLMAFIAFSYISSHNTIQNLVHVTALVRKAREKTPLVVVSFHGGAEGSDYTRVKNQTEYFLGENRGNVVAFAHAAIDAGAALVLGHGPHVPRALELYRNHLIAYSLGNFMGYRVFSTRNYNGVSLILQVALDNEGNFLSGQITPLRLSKEGVPAVDPEKRSIELLRKLTAADFPSSLLEIGAGGEVRRK